MIDFETIEDFDEYDGENVHAFACNADTGEWRWSWIPLESIYESGREDIIEGLGLTDGYALAA